MHPLIEFIIGLVALIAATALAQFDIDLRASNRAEPEVRRVACTEPAAPPADVARQDC